MTTNLPTTSGDGTQNTTQDPQSAGTSSGNGTQAAAVQPGTTSLLLDAASGGVPLTAQKLPTIALAPTNTSVAHISPAPLHHSPVLTAVSALLFVIAVALVISTLMPTKNTTD